MKIDGTPYRTIWPNDGNRTVTILDQTKFPHVLEEAVLSSVNEAAHAISSMQVRGAPLIGATAAYGVALATITDLSDANIIDAAKKLAATRPTAINLQWALDRMMGALLPVELSCRAKTAWSLAAQICDEDVANNSRIGDYGLEVIETIAATKPAGHAVNILTHCNAGWLATVDWGTATSPMYKAFNKGLSVHIYVDETRPRNQGAHLTAWELRQHGVPHTLIVDNAGGHLMQHGKVDLVIVGSDRTTGHGDVCNKIGTYLKALAARDNDVPFYVALPTSTIDFGIEAGLEEIPIEERLGDEVTVVNGLAENGDVVRVSIAPADTVVANPAFDVTPRHLITGLITEKGIVEATPEALASLRAQSDGPTFSSQQASA